MKAKHTAVLLLGLLVLPMGVTGAEPRWTLTVRPADREHRPDDPSVETIYALGDWGTGNDKQAAVARAFVENAKTIEPGRRVPPFGIEMGDNIYPDGLPRVDNILDSWRNPDVDAALHATFGEMYAPATYAGKPIVFHIVPGNHDHRKALQRPKKKGDVLLQEARAESLYAGWWKYYPIDHARAGIGDTNDYGEYQGLRRHARTHGIDDLTYPEAIDQRSEYITIVALDSQVMLELYDRADDGDEASARRIGEYWQRVDALMAASRSPWKALMAHHPVSTFGSHGKHQWYERFWKGPDQDLFEDDYEAFREDLLAAMVRNGIHLYFAGHDHNLQVQALDTLKPDDIEAPGREYLQIVSGGAGKYRGLDEKDAAKNASVIGFHDGMGFVRLDLTRDTLWIEIVTESSDAPYFRSIGMWRVTRTDE